MLRLNKIKIAGFRSVSADEPVELEFPRGSFLIEGPNGAGKTTISSEALYWCLFGKGLRGEYADSVINRDAKIAVVAAEFEDKALGKVTAERTRARGGKTTFTFATEDGKDLLAGGGTSLAGAKLPVEAVLGAKASTIQATTFYSPSRGLMEASDAERRELLEDVLGIDWLREARDRALVAAKEAAAQVAQLSEQYARSVGASTASSSAALEFRAQLQAAKDAWGRDLQKEAIAAQQAAEQYTQQVTELDEQVAHHQGVLQERHAEYAKAREADKQVEELRSAALQAVAEAKANKTQAEYLVEEARKAEREAAAVACPTCARPFDPEARRQATERAAQLLAERSQALEEAATRWTRKQADLAQIIAARAPSSALGQLLATTSQGLSEINGRLQDLERQLATAQHNQQVTMLEASRLRANMSSSPEAGASAPEAVQRLQLALSKAEKEAQDAAQLAQDLGQKREQAQKREQILDWWKSTAFGAKGVRAFALENVLPVLSHLANYYLGQLSQHTLALDISPTKQLKSGKEVETLDVLVRNVRGVDSSVDASTGERRIADVALTLAVHRLVVQRGGKGLGVASLDEPLDALDEVRAANVVSLLNGLAADEGLTIGVVSHSDGVRGHFERVLCVDRDPATGWTRARWSGLPFSVKKSEDTSRERETEESMIGEPISTPVEPQRAAEDTTETSKDDLKDEVIALLGDRPKKQKTALIKRVTPRKTALTSLTKAELSALRSVLLSERIQEEQRNAPAE